MERGDRITTAKRHTHLLAQSHFDFQERKMILGFGAVRPAVRDDGLSSYQRLAQP
jgi:hypothetical protein